MTNKPDLIPNRYPQNDLFICDVADAILKDVMHQMEHPFYSLSKKPETRIRYYEHNGNTLEIIPSVKGLATIYDKDILIYCISKVMAKIKTGEEVAQKVRINSHELLKFTNRGTAGKDYKALKEALDRLAGTRITTNIITGNEEQTDGFGLIETFGLKRKNGLDGRLLWCDIKLSDWIFNAIDANEVLTLHKDYFRLRKPLERRIYEIARKHCGQKKSWEITIEKLHKKSGSRGNLREFKRAVKTIEKNNYLPDYLIEFKEESHKIIFTNRDTMPKCNDSKEWNGLLPPLAFEKLENLDLNIDKYQTENEFRYWLKKKEITPANPTALFLTFAKNKAKRLQKMGVIPYKTR